MYPITAEEADAVLYRALRSTAPEADVTAVAGPNKGYVAVINKDRRSYTYYLRISGAGGGTQARRDESWWIRLRGIRMAVDPGWVSG